MTEKHYKTNCLKYYKSVFSILFFLYLSISLSSSANNIMLNLEMPSHSFSAGMECKLKLTVSNYGKAIENAALFLGLDAGLGCYWFYPTWNMYPENVDWIPIDLPFGHSETMIIIPEFQWPEGIDTRYNLSFYAAVMDGDHLKSNIADFKFHILENPGIFSITPPSSVPGNFLELKGMGYNFKADSIKVTIDDYEFNPVAIKNNQDSMRSLITSVPALAPGQYQVHASFDGYNTNSVQLIIDEQQSSSQSPGTIFTEMSAGMSLLYSYFYEILIPDAVTFGIIQENDQNAFYETINNSQMVWNTFSEMFHNLDPEDQEKLEYYLNESGVYELISGISDNAISDDYGMPETSAASCLLLTQDTTSLILSGLDLAWTTVDQGLLVETAESNGAKINLAATSLGLHLSLEILDILLDQMLPTDLKEININGVTPGSIIEFSLESFREFKMLGRFACQDPIDSKNYLDKIHEMIPEDYHWLNNYREFLQETVIMQLETIDLSPECALLGESLIDIGQPEPENYPLGFKNITDNPDLKSKIEMTIFHNVSTRTSDLLDTLSSFSLENELTSNCIWCLNCLEGISQDDAIKIRSLDCTKSGYPYSFWFKWSTFTSDALSENLETGQQNSVRYSYKTRYDIPSGFSYIPPGTFNMGSPPDERCRYPHEGPFHQVTLTRGYYIMKEEVNQGQWNALCEYNPSVYFSLSALPMQYIRWHEAVLYCNRLSVSEGLTPCYYFDKEYTRVYERELPIEDLPHFHWKADAEGYRLPTEAEWERACRAESDTAFYNGPFTGSCYGNDIRLDDIASYMATTVLLLPGGLFEPNKWGLFDMLGNAYEFCWDIYNEDYYDWSPSVDPTGGIDFPWSPVLSRVLKGGSHYNYPDRCRSGNRDGCNYGRRYTDVGFRVVRYIQQTTN